VGRRCRFLTCGVVCLGIGVLVAACSTSKAGHNAAASKHTPNTSTTTTTFPSVPTTALTTPTASIQDNVIASCPGGTNAPTHPTKIELGCSGGIYSVTGITWSEWSTTTAAGTGTFSENTCQPNCSSGTTFYTSPGSIYVVDPVGGVFQEVVITASGLRGPLNAFHPGTSWGSE
jgi:hypothetical protein